MEDKRLSGGGGGAASGGGGGDSSKLDLQLFGVSESDFAGVPCGRFSAEEAAGSASFSSITGKHGAFSSAGTSVTSSSTTSCQFDEPKVFRV